MLQLIADNKIVETNRILFSDGAVSFDLEDFPPAAKRVVISVSPDFKVNGLFGELNQLLYTLHDVCKNSDLTVEMNIPYLPYARADRKFSENGNKGLEYFISDLECNQISKIYTVDPHNPKALVDLCESAKIDLEYLSQLQAFKHVVEREHLKPTLIWDVVVAPDKGAKDKAKTIAEYYGIPLVCCTKERDVTTGKLSNPFVPERLDGKRVLIVDDLSDYAGTFVQLGNALYAAGCTDVQLYVTHLISPNKLENLLSVISKVYCYQTVCGYITLQDVQKFNNRGFVYG